MMNIKQHRAGLAFISSVLILVFVSMNGFTQQAMLTGSAIGIRQATVSQGAATALNCSTGLTCTVNAGVATMTASGGGGGAAGASLFSATASTTVTATSATTLIGTVTGSTTVPVNTFTAGQVLEIFAEGYLSTPATPASLTVDMLVGGSARVTTGAVQVIASITNGTWQFHCLVTTRTIGGSGTQIANCTFFTSGFSGAIPARAYAMQTASTWTIDTTATQGLDLQATWSTAVGSPTITCTNISAWIPGAPVTSAFGQTGAVDIPILTTDVSTPANPAAGKTKAYSKGGKWCSLDSSGNENCTGTSGGSSGLVLVEEHTASNSASLNFTTCVSSTYDNYQLQLVNIIPVTNAANLLMRFSTDGGSTYDSGSNYDWVITFSAVGTGPGRAEAASATAIQILGGLPTTPIGASGSFMLNDPLNAATFKSVFGQMADVNAGVWLTQQGAGEYKSNTAANAFQFLMSSGNISSGTVRCYGLAK